MVETVKYIPKWFPLAGFKQKARRFNEDRQKMFDEPFGFSKQQIVWHLLFFSFLVLAFLLNTL
jgi:hypothetical protein